MITPQFQDFLNFLDNTHSAHTGFVLDIHEKLTGMGCKFKVTTTKAFPFQVAYTRPGSRKGILNFYLRKKGLKTRVTITDPASHAETLHRLPPNMLAQMGSQNPCRKLTEGCECLETCSGFDFYINDTHYQKCRFDCFKFDVDGESIPFFIDLLERELEIRRKPMELTVMSFNVRNDCDPGTEAWSARIVNFIPLVKGANPDLIGFQEVLPHMYEDLRRLLPEYGSVGIGREDGINQGEYAAIFYKKDRFTLLDTGSFWLSETPDAPSFGWDAACVRICTFAHLRENSTQKALMHFNTHMDHVGATAQYEGAKLIREAVLGSKASAFVTGDFNIVEQSAPYQILTANGLKDAKYAAKSTMSHGTIHDYKPGEHMNDASPIDYLFFVDGKFTVDSYEVLINGSPGAYTSDHYPILVKMRGAQ